MTRCQNPFTSLHYRAICSNTKVHCCGSEIYTLPSCVFNVPLVFVLSSPQPPNWGSCTHTRYQVQVHGLSSARFRHIS